MGFAYYLNRQYKESVHYYGKALELSGGGGFSIISITNNVAYGHLNVAYGHLFNGTVDEAIKENKKEKNDTLQLFTNVLIDLKQNQKSKAKSDFDLFKKRAKDQYNYSCHLGILHGWFGNKDEAFRLLNIALAKKNFLMRSIKRDPLFDPLRNDPRFEVLVKKMDFPE